MCKSILLNVFTILILAGCALAQENCSDFSKGKFRPKYGPFMNNYEVTRTDSTQIDFDKVYNSKNEYEIIWLDDCRYKLKRTKGRIHEGYQGFDLIHLTFTINEADIDGYSYLITIDNTNTLLDTSQLLRID